MTVNFVIIDLVIVDLMIVDLMVDHIIKMSIYDDASL